MQFSYKKPVFIYNPNAGAGRAEKMAEQYIKEIKKTIYFDSIEIYKTKAPKDAAAYIGSLKDYCPYDLVITMGGDGTISEVCNGLMMFKKDKRIPIFPLPSGSGNSLLRDFSITKLEHSIESYKKGSFRIFDVLEVKGKDNFKTYCVNVLGLGFVSNIADFVVKNSKRLGHSSYLLGTILALQKFQPYKTKFTYNGGKEIFETDRGFLISVSNTKFSGGKIMVAPDAECDDGLMDVVILHDINRLQFLNGFKDTFKGKHITHKGCKYFKTKDLEITSDVDFLLMPDGELEGYSPVKVKILPNEIKFIV